MQLRIDAQTQKLGLQRLTDAAADAGALAAEFRSVAEAVRAFEGEAAVNRFGAAVEAYGRLVQAMVESTEKAGATPPAGFQDCLRALTEGMRRAAQALAVGDATGGAKLADREVAANLDALAGMVRRMTGQP
jgi:hypothetical protein